MTLDLFGMVHSTCVCLMKPVMEKHCIEVTCWCAQSSKTNLSTVNSSMPNHFHDHSQGFACGGSEWAKQDGRLVFMT